MAKRVHQLLYETRLGYSFEKEEVKEISLRLAAYFEDVISGLNIWRSFILEYKKLFDTYLPFYQVSDNYYEDEVNLEDIRFLLWHYTQQYHGARKGTFVSPDNQANEDSARKIYDFFCDEWTVAPENEKMQKLFAPETRYEDETVFNNLIHWFHYNSYLFTDSNEELTETVKAYWKMNPMERGNDEVVILHNALAHFSKTAMLAYTSPKWLSLIMPESHPDYALFAKRGKETQEATLPVAADEEEKIKQQIEKFREKAGDKKILYFESKKEVAAFIENELDIREDLHLEQIYQMQLALYASEKDGLQLILHGVECIKDENNPYYNQKIAAEQAIAYFIVKQVSIDFLYTMAENHMLDDAQAKSLISEARSKAIVQDNWQFISRYFLREYK